MYGVATLTQCPEIDNTHRVKFTGFIITYAAVRPAARLQLAFAKPPAYTPVPDIIITSHALLATFTVSPPALCTAKATNRASYAKLRAQ